MCQEFSMHMFRIANQAAKLLSQGLEVSCFNHGMDTWIYENRRKWLERWIAQAGGRPKFEEKYGYTRSQIAQFLSPEYNDGRSIGDVAARRIEKKLGKPPRSMDEKFDAQPPVQQPDAFSYKGSALIPTTGNADLQAELGELVLLYLQADAGEREIILGTARSTQDGIATNVDDAANKR